MHGPRRDEAGSGEVMMSFDLMGPVHGMSQAVWELRRLVGWLRAEQSATAVGVYGISLGGYAAALGAATFDGLSAAVAGIPASDLLALYRHHAPARLRRRAVEHHVFGPEAQAVHRVISPLAMTPFVPRDRRFVYAGLGDRMSTPHQAHRLWEHWDRPEVLWYDGNHVGFMWSKDVDKFVRGALEASGLAAGVAAG